LSPFAGHADEHELSDNRTSKANVIRSKSMFIIQNHRPPPCALSGLEWYALKVLKERQDIVTIRADKGNATIVLDKDKYESKIKTLLHDPSTYVELRSNPLNKIEKTVNAFVSDLLWKEKITTGESFKLKSSDASVPRLYCLPKINKERLPLRPIVSFIGSPTYNLAKEIARFLQPLVGNTAHHVRNSIEFADEVKTMIVQENEVMVSFDVVSLFTKIPVELALEVTQRRLMDWTEFENYTNWSIEDVCQSLKICLESTFLHFRGKNYKQVFGTTMGSPVSAVVANIVMEEIESRAMKTFFYAPRLWKRYVDDTFVWIEQKHLTNFADHINKVESSIKFTMETKTMALFHSWMY